MDQRCVLVLINWIHKFNSLSLTSFIKNLAGQRIIHLQNLPLIRSSSSLVSFCCYPTTALICKLFMKLLFYSHKKVCLSMQWWHVSRFLWRNHKTIHVLDYSLQQFSKLGQHCCPVETDRRSPNNWILIKVLYTINYYLNVVFYYIVKHILLKNQTIILFFAKPFFLTESDWDDFKSVI